MIKRAPDPELGARLRSAKLRRVDSMEDAGELMTWLGSRRQVLGVDTETTGLEWNCRLRTVQVGDGSAGWLIPWDDWAGLAREVLGKYAGRMAIWNAAYDVPVLARHGIHLSQHLVDDPMLLAHLDDSSWSVAQKRRAEIHLDTNAALLQETLDDGMRRHGWGWDTVPYTWAPAWMYGALDPVEAALMWELYRPVAEAHADVFDVLQASSWALTRASMHGTRIDVEYAQTYGAALDDRAAECLATASQKWGLTSLGSSAAIAAILEADGVELSARTASGAPSITKDVLQGLADKHPLAALVLSYRHAAKFRAAYVDGVLSRLDGDLVHPSIRAVGARTGRTSVSAPPLQQIPAGDPEPRRMFIPREGRVLLSVDMSAIEVRILAHLAGKGTLTSAFERGEDPHLATAARMYGAERSAEMRKKAKAGCVPLSYPILTARGWLSHRDVRPGDMTIGYNTASRRTEWTQVTAVHHYAAQPVVSVRTANREVFRCTPDHRWIAERRDRGGGRCSVEPLEDLPRDVNLILAGTGAGPRYGAGSSLTADQAAVLAWLHTDGHAEVSALTGRTSQGADGHRRGMRGRIYQLRPRGVQDLERLSSSGIVREVGSGGPARCWEVSASTMRTLWRSSGLWGGGTIEAAVLGMSDAALTAFVGACEAADGSTDPGRAQFTHRPSDILRGYMLAVWRLGRFPLASPPRQGPRYQSVNVNARRDGVTLQTAQREDAGHEDVWCVTTELGTWTTRATDITGPMLTGNSFAAAYGAGPKTVSIQQGISLAAAKKFLGEYYTAMPEVDTLIKNLQRAGRERGRQDGRGWTQTGRGRIIWLSGAEEGYGQHYKLTNYCLAPDTPILTSDLRHVPARTVAVGDRLVGFDEHRSPERGRAGHRKFRVAEVEAVSRVVKPCVELEFSNGKSVICSTDHQWLVRRAAQNVRYTWARTDELRPDDEFLDIGTWEYDGAAMAGGERLFGHPTVIACRSVGDAETVSIQTSTRTLIANGLLSHNCIQGTAADITHTATALLAADGVTDGRLLLAVHDELLFDVAPDEVDEITEQVKTAFGTAGQLAGLSIPVVCDAEVYDTSWAQSVTG